VRIRRQAATVLPVIDTEDDLSAGIVALTESDPRLRLAHEVGGRPPLRRRAGDLEGLASIVAGQQVSKASAAAIWTRMLDVLAPFTADRLAGFGDETYREAGLSRPKVRTLRAIADAMIGGSLDLERLASLDDHAVRAALTAVTGIGPWTADIYLLSCLGRADAWPAGDLALQVAAQEVAGLEARPDPKAMDALAEDWRPWRGVAARLLWSYYGATRARDIVP
jgi:DNA-3-methyladenine glycosylase II